MRDINHLLRGQCRQLKVTEFKTKIKEQKNSAILALKRAEEAFAGEASKVGFEPEEDMKDYMREIRKEVRGLDTNVFISMIFFPSGQTRKLAKWLMDEHQIMVCDYVIEELWLVVDLKFTMKRTA